jgi:hypothetical protein
MAEPFEPQVDFYNRRQTQGQALFDRLPKIRINVTRREKAPLMFLDPAPRFTADIDSAAGIRVGTATYGVNPLNDKLYVFEVKIIEDHQRQGYGLAFLWTLHQEHGLPITPNHIWGSARGFWHKAHQLRALGVSIDPELRYPDLDQEKARWAHLIPEPEHLRLIREYEASQRQANVSEGVPR